MSESEQRIHGALQKEREKRREARAELKAVREELESLKQQLLTPKPAEPPQAAPADGTPAPATPPPATALPGDPLADCTTFDQVDARAMQAASLEARVMRMQTQLSRDGVEAVKAALTAEGVKDLRGVPLAEADDAQVGDFLARVYEGARLTQVAAEPRKRFLSAQENAFQQARQLVPELADAKSERAREFDAFVKQNPWLPMLGAHWPLVASTYLLGLVEVKKLTAKGNGKAATPAPPVARPAPAAAAPAAPTRTASPLPKASETDELATLIKSGTATAADVARYAARQVVAPR